MDSHLTSVQQSEENIRPAIECNLQIVERDPWAGLEIAYRDVVNRGFVKLAAGPGSPEDRYTRAILATQGLSNTNAGDEFSEEEDSTSESNQVYGDPEEPQAYWGLAHRKCASREDGDRNGKNNVKQSVTPRPVPDNGPTNPQTWHPRRVPGNGPIKPRTWNLHLAVASIAISATDPTSVPKHAHIPLPFRILPPVYMPFYHPTMTTRGPNGPLPLLVPVPHRETVRKKARGTEVYPWTPARQRMWMAAHPGSPLPDEASTTTYNYLHIGTPACVNLTLLGELPITAIEILTYFPLHTIWREILHRLNSAGWAAANIVEFIYWSRGIGCRDAIKRTAIQHQIGNTKNWATARTIIPAWSCANISTDNGLQGHRADLIDFPIINLVDGVLFYPSGRDEGALTKAIQRCRSTNDFTVTLATVGTYITLHHLDWDLAPRDQLVRTADARALVDNGPVSKEYYRKIVGMHT